MRLLLDDLPQRDLLPDGGICWIPSGIPSASAFRTRPRSVALNFAVIASVSVLAVWLTQFLRHPDFIDGLGTSIKKLHGIHREHLLHARWRPLNPHLFQESIVILWIPYEGSQMSKQLPQFVVSQLVPCTKSTYLVFTGHWDITIRTG